MTVLCEHVEAEAVLHTTGATTPLLRVGSRNERVNQPRELPSFVETHLSMLARVDDARHVGNGDAGLCNVGSQYNLAHAWRWHKESRLLVFRSNR